ncbi:conserved hypothetical protein [Neospora caninum Liverpool]|uniref:Uncharacterized protein n=1 Tax=Neospora caninum (strain Liverpool) TaxID=572307 RepID=F0V9F6_NEOCL|nr:conserved hypothetical protein [Neospora caninum Liverpool]CBZ50381.1 conserved hypothetical protein [Neospora caninum Liverpool]|eukprot:XP_003880415.1 conserved hypothetical protein [Neospora caninum Liverpool]
MSRRLGHLLEIRRQRRGCSSKPARHPSLSLSPSSSPLRPLSPLCAEASRAPFICPASLWGVSPLACGRAPAGIDRPSSQSLSPPPPLFALSKPRLASDWFSAVLGKLQGVANRAGAASQNAQAGAGAAADSVREHGLFGAASAIEQKASAFFSRLTDVQQRQLEKQGLLASRFYRFLVISLMEKEGVFTYYDFYVWRKGCLDYLKAAEEEMQGIVGKSARKLADLGWEKLRPSTSPEFKEMELHLKILSHFTPEELSRDTAEHFTSAAIKNIAKAAETSVKDVKNVLLGHAIALTDRTWYMRLMEMGRPIPQSVEDYLLLAETDRPYMIRLPYGEKFYNYELEQALAKERAANRFKSQRDVPRLGRKQHRIRRLYIPNERVAFDRWARIPHSRLDAYGNFLFRLNQAPKGQVSIDRAVEREKHRAEMAANAEFYSDAALSASRITLNNLPPGAFRRRTGMQRKNGEIHHVAPPRDPVLRELFGAAIQREKDEKKERELMTQERAEAEQKKDAYPSSAPFGKDSIWG